MNEKMHDRLVQTNSMTVDKVHWVLVFTLSNVKINTSD